MIHEKSYDVIIIGASYAGLSAGMTLGRSRRNVLIIDSGNPCNRQTPHSHNFLTQDGKTPKEISTEAKRQIEKYNTVQIYNGLAIDGKKNENGFEISTNLNDRFKANKLIFATGIKDIMPTLQGFSECWGISVIHCPYCHGYEYSMESTGILANGDTAFELGKLLSNWTKDLTIFTNGKSTIALEQLQKLKHHNISIVEKEIESLNHHNGYLNSIKFQDNTSKTIKALYSRPNFEQHCEIPKQLGCNYTETNYIMVDPFQKTSEHGIFACGDNSSIMRSVSLAVATGGIAGMMTNKELIEEEF